MEDLGTVMMNLIKFNISSQSYDAEHKISQILTRKEEFKDSISFFEISRVDQSTCKYTHPKNLEQDSTGYRVHRHGTKHNSHVVKLHVLDRNMKSVITGLRKYGREMLNIHKDNHEPFIYEQSTYNLFFLSTRPL